MAGGPRAPHGLEGRCSASQRAGQEQGAGVKKGLGGVSGGGVLRPGTMSPRSQSRVWVRAGCRARVVAWGRRPALMRGPPPPSAVAAEGWGAEVLGVGYSPSHRRAACGGCGGRTRGQPLHLGLKNGKEGFSEMEKNVEGRGLEN